MEYQSSKSFTDLLVWQEGHRFVLSVYRLSRKFPTEERFSLTNQIQRAVVSITSNIAEGFSRRSSKEKVQFYFISLASLAEVQNQLLIARDLGYLPKKDFQEMAEKSVIIRKMLNRLVGSIRNA
ncbi:MAG: four helix bundle protein [Candidatus Spechtbacterales bacterium]